MTLFTTPLRLAWSGRRTFAIRHNGSHFRKPVITPNEAVHMIPSGSTLLVGGFGLCGIPEKVLNALARNPTVNSQSIVSNDCGVDDFGLGPLMRNGQVSSLTASYVGANRICKELYLTGGIELHLVPQGTIAESLRAGGAGIPFFYTKSGANTIYANGTLVTKYGSHGEPLQFNTRKESFEHADGKTYLKEHSRRGDFALIKAWKADRAGNLLFRETARNFNPVMAKAAKVTIAEVETIVETGDIDPDAVHLPGIYVDYLIAGNGYEKRIEHLTVSRGDPDPQWKGAYGAQLSSPVAQRERIARRAAMEFSEGMYVNLGIGIPEHSSNFIPKGMTVHIDSENGVLGLGPFPRPDEVDADLVNAGKETVTVFSGASYFSSDESFAMIRGGHFDVSMLGAFQVSQYGDLANWIIPGKVINGMGGAMDLANSGSLIIVTMTHLDEHGTPKIRGECSLPLTASRCVSRIITDKAVFDVDPKEGLTLREIAHGETVESVKEVTPITKLSIASNLTYF